MSPVLSPTEIRNSIPFTLSIVSSRIYRSDNGCYSCSLSPQIRQKSYTSARNPTLFFSFLSGLFPASISTATAAPPVSFSSLPSFSPYVLPGPVVRRSETPPSTSRCNVSMMRRFLVHLNAKLFSPQPDPVVDDNPRSVECLSLGGNNVWGAGKLWIRNNP
jgi:hypothetical protein